MLVGYWSFSQTIELPPSNRPRLGRGLAARVALLVVAAPTPVVPTAAPPE